MSAPASRPVHPCSVTVTKHGSRGAEFSTWAYLTHHRHSTAAADADDTTDPAAALPNLVTASGSSIHVHSHCPQTGKLKVEYSFPHVAGTIVFLETLSAKNPDTECDALLVGFGSPARLSVVTLEEQQQGRILQAVSLLDFSSIFSDYSCGATTQEDAIYTMLGGGGDDLYIHTQQATTGTHEKQNSNRIQKSSYSRQKRPNRSRRPGYATVAAIIGGGTAVAVTELVSHLLPNQDQQQHTHGWIAQEPYVLPLYSLSTQLPHLRDSATAEQDANANAGAAAESSMRPMVTGWGDILHAAFLSGYLEPVLVLLHTPPGGTTWAGRLARENTMGPPPLYLTALSVSVSHERTALLWSLPTTNDAHTILPLSNGTSCLVLGVNSIVSVLAGRIHQVMAVNGWAHATYPAVLKPRLHGNVPVKLALQLDGSQCCLVTENAALIVLRRGQVYLLQRAAGLWSVVPTGQSLMSMGEVAHLRSLPLLSLKSQPDLMSKLFNPKKMATKKEGDQMNDSFVNTGLVFAGSRLGDSLLMGYTVDTTMIPMSAMEQDDNSEKKDPKSEQRVKVDPEEKKAIAPIHEDEDILAMEEEELYAPVSKTDQSTPNVVPPSEDEGEDDYLQMRKRQRSSAKCSILRELKALDRLVNLGPLGASQEGPIAGAPDFVSLESSVDIGEDARVYSAPAFVFPSGFGSSGGLALVTAPGRDDRMIAAEEDCLNVECIFSLPRSNIVLLGMSEKSDGGGIKIFKETHPNGEAQMEELDLSECLDQDAISMLFGSSALLLNASEVGDDGTFCVLLQKSEGQFQLSWSVCLMHWDRETEKGSVVKEIPLISTNSDEKLDSSTPFLIGEDSSCVGLRWSSGRASILLFSADGANQVCDIPDGRENEMEQDDEKFEEDPDAKRIKDFYDSKNVVSIDVFRARKGLSMPGRLGEGQGALEEEAPEITSSDGASKLEGKDFDEDDMELYGITPLGDPKEKKESLSSDSEKPKRLLDDDSNGFARFVAVFRQNGILELYTLESDGSLSFCWECFGGARGLHILAPSPRAPPLSLPRSHTVKIEEARFFECGPSLDEGDEGENHFRNMCLAVTTSSGDFFLYSTKQRGRQSFVFEREIISTQCRKTQEQARHKTKLSKKGMIPKLSPNSSWEYSYNKLHRFQGISGQDGLFAAITQPKWVVTERGRPTTLNHRTRHSAPAGGSDYPVAGFSSPLSTGGFLTLHERVGRYGSQRLTMFKGISSMFDKDGLIPGGGVCIERISMGVTVRQLQFIDDPTISSPDHPLYAVLVSRELEVDQSDLNDDGMTAEERAQAEKEKEEARIQRQVEADLGGFDVEQEWVEEIARDDVFKIDKTLGGAPPVQKEFYSIWIVDAANEWRVVDSFDLEEYEHGLTLRVMQLSEFKEEPGSASSETLSEDLPSSTFVTCGTGTLNHNGEDVASKGRALLFEVKRFDPSMVKRMGSQMVAGLKLVYEKEIFHGPVTTLACLSIDGRNRLIVGAGADINVEQWGNGRLTQVGFFRATMQIVEIMMFKSFLLLSDAYDSLYFLVWRESDKSLTLLAKDYDPIAVYAAGIMSRGKSQSL